jgi:glycosyltransferase involved in cell wall biosynthesis
MILKADLHCHSKYSEHPSEWFLQRIGASESYSEPEMIYKLAKKQGMDFVTITDHNKIEGSLLLHEAHPKDTFLGVESSVYFPEDHCKIHILLYDFNEKQFDEIQKYRKDIYEFRDYIKENNLIYSVAHVNDALNGKLTVGHIEKLLLLFDNFEVKNGARAKTNNNSIRDVIDSLNPQVIDRLYTKHKIEPLSDNPWIKGKTGGSDDHAALFIGQTYTKANAKNRKDFLISINNKFSEAEGRHNDFYSLVFTIYKIAWEYSQSKSSKLNKGIVANINDLIFDSKQLTMLDWVKLKVLNVRLKENDVIARNVIDLVNKLDKSEDNRLDSRLDLLYDTISTISDKIVSDLALYFRNNEKELNIYDIVGKVSSLLPAIFLTVPFVTAFNHLFDDRKLIVDMRVEFGVEQNKKNKNILWFTDTINDLNGVSMFLKEIALTAYEQGRNITFITTFDENENVSSMPPNVIQLPCVVSFEAPYYSDHLKLKLPSLLKSLKVIYDTNPDEIYISTPGFTGLLGLLASKLLRIPSSSIYHSDFKKQLSMIADDHSWMDLVGEYVQWFYQATDTVAAPTKEYARILANEGFPDSKLKIFKRWIDLDLFKPNSKAQSKLRKRYNLDNNSILLFTGRVSNEKNIDLVINAIKSLEMKSININLIIAGDGPYLKELKKYSIKKPGIVLTGRLDRNELIDIYAGSDLFVFPSDSDTFGMSVLEAQACGLPCLVTDVGGPQEIIIDKKSGFAIRANDQNEWTAKIRELVELMNSSPDDYKKLRKNSRDNVVRRYNKKVVFNDFIGDSQEA